MPIIYLPILYIPLHLGFQNAFGSLGLSLLSAVAGIVDHPIKNITAATNTSEAIKGAFTGLAKGMVGAVAKPIGGAMEFVSQASQGILQGSGLIITQQRIYTAAFDAFHVDRKSESSMKLLWFVKFILNSFYMLHKVFWFLFRKFHFCLSVRRVFEN